MTMSNDNGNHDFDRAASSDVPTPRGISAKLIVFALLLAVGVIFVLQNRERKSVDFLVFEINSRQWVNIAVAIVLGVALDRLFLSWWHRRAKSKKK